MENDKYDIEDLVSNALSNNPSEFENAFTSLIHDRLVDAVAQKKQEISKKMFTFDSTESEIEEI